jgi:hypothetical protein
MKNVVDMKTFNHTFPRPVQRVRADGTEISIISAGVDRKLQVEFNDACKAAGLSVSAVLRTLVQETVINLKKAE